MYDSGTEIFYKNNKYIRSSNSRVILFYYLFCQSCHYFLISKWIKNKAFFAQAPMVYLVISITPELSNSCIVLHWPNAS